MLQTPLQHTFPVVKFLFDSLRYRTSTSLRGAKRRGKPYPKNAAITEHFHKENGLPQPVCGLVSQ